MNLSFSLITQMKKYVACRNAVCIFCISAEKTIRSENVCALTRFKYSARIHPRLDTLANCHRQHLASGALPQLQLLSVAALASTKSVQPWASCNTEKLKLNFSLITQMEKDVECRNAVCIFCISCRFVLKVFVHSSALTSRGIHGVT